MDDNYWEMLKKYFETEYHGIVPNEKCTMYAYEIKNGAGTILYDNRRFDPYDVSLWITETQELAMDEASDGISVSETEMVAIFPHLFDYTNFSEEIAAFFMWEDINRFKDELKKGNAEYVKEAIRLNWRMMLEEVPAIRNVFLF
jgi:hypothetical protein